MFRFLQSILPLQRLQQFTRRSIHDDIRKASIFTKMNYEQLCNHKKYLERVRTEIDSELRTLQIFVQLEYDAHLRYVQQLHSKRNAMQRKIKQRQREKKKA